MTEEKPNAEDATHVLSEEQIVSQPRKRRAFLGAALLGSVAMAGAGFIQACKKTDQCDFDTAGFRDSDPRDLTRTTADRCDSDGTGR